MNRLLQSLGLTIAVVMMEGVLYGENAASESPAVAPTGRVMLVYDTEDYTWEGSADATLFHADLLTEFGFRGCFNCVGFWCQRVHEWGREDVFAALRRHSVGSQTYRHSWHPTINEYTDIEDWEKAYRRCLMEEAQAVGMVKAGVCVDELTFAEWAGSNFSPVFLYVYGDMGIKLLGGMTNRLTDNKYDRLVWYCNTLQFPYNAAFDNDTLASRHLTVIGTHPCMLLAAEFWDAVNFRGGNLCEWRKWKPPPQLSPEKQEMNKQWWRSLMTRIKNDKRLTVITVEDITKEIKPRTAIRRTDVPMLLKHVETGLEPVEKPASWCIYDIFRATVEFLRGANESMPDKAWGFLYCPEGISTPTTVKRSSVVATAAKINLDYFLPPSFDVGGIRLGPADLLVAMLRALNSDTEDIVLEPREQVGLMGKHFPKLPDYTYVGDWGIFSPEFKDEWLSNRLRWQFWTMRYER